MEKYRYKNPELDHEIVKKRLTSVDRLFFGDDADSFEEEPFLESVVDDRFYDEPVITDYPQQEKTERKTQLEDPVFFSVYEKPIMRSKPAANPHPTVNKPVSHPSKPVRLKALETKAKHKKTPPQTKTDKKKLAVFVSLVATFALILLTVVGFILAYRFSDSHTYLVKRDKTAPQADIFDITLFSFETFYPEEMLQNITDDTMVSITQMDAVDYSTSEPQLIRLKLTDEAKNETVLSAYVTIINDVTAPTINCEPLVRITVGQSMAYKSLVFLADDYDSEPTLSIDNSQVDLSRAGTYPVTFTATDKSGNTASKTCHIEVSEFDGYVADEDVWELVDAMLGYIITEDMDDLHKVWAIYEYVRNIPYVLTDYSYNYMYEGYKILHDNRGDCYGSYAASKLMFDRLGIDNLSIQTNENGRHFWNMVSLDDGKTWYHFDATQWTQWWERPVMCMISSAELQRISEEHYGTHRYDTAGYPKTPQQSMPVPDDIEEIYGYDY